MSKFFEFNPEPSKWSHDKRIYDRATEGLEKLVTKNFSKHAIPCVAIYPDMDPKTGHYRGYRVAAPDGPLRNYFEQDDVKASFFALLRDATLDAVAKKKEKLDGKEVTATCSVVKTVGLSKPPRPVWTLTVDELDTYFTTLKSEIAKQEGVKLRPKWPKIVNNVTVTAPTPIPSFDDVLERILPSAIYIPKKKFPLANHHWRLKLACAYLLFQYDFDPNTFALDIPNDFQPKIFAKEAFEKMSRNIAGSDAAHNARRNCVAVDDDDADDDEENENYDEASDEEEEELYRQNDGGREVQVPRSDLEPEMYIPDLPERFEPDSLPGPSTEPDFLDESYGTGTPLNSTKENDDEDEEVFLNDLENEMQEAGEHIDLLKKTNLKLLLTGREKGQPVVQLFNFKKLARAKCYRSDALDGKIATTKITFSANVNDKVEEVFDKMPLIRITDFILFNGSFLFVKDFEVIKTIDYKLADVEYLGPKDYEEIRAVSKPNPDLPQTPSLVQKKLSNKNVTAIQQVPTRAASQRSKTKKKHCNSC